MFTQPDFETFIPRRRPSERRRDRRTARRTDWMKEY